jgi:undecaprenyl-phosphate 4-deoxy-4-formamido-L-arabinose transferase
MPVPSLSIVIPVYNSEQSLPLLLSRLDSMLETLADQDEVILVNDGSRDGSGRIIDSASMSS